MNTVLVIITTIVVAIFGMMLIDYLRNICPYCRTKMEKYYDPEEDAEVYQCPKCGRAFIK